MSKRRQTNQHVHPSLFGKCSVSLRSGELYSLSAHITSESDKEREKKCPAGCIHVKMRLEEVGRSEQRDFIKANGDLHSGQTHKVQKPKRTFLRTESEVTWPLHASKPGTFFLTICRNFYFGTLR